MQMIKKDYQLKWIINWYLHWACISTSSSFKWFSSLWNCCYCILLSNCFLCI